MNATKDIGYDIIENSSQLAQLVSRIENETTIGVDVEADSMYHFKEKVCLIQMATCLLYTSPSPRDTLRYLV